MGFKNKKSRDRFMSRVEQAGYKFTLTGQLEHRVVCRKAWGPYPRHWVVHHIDENPSNNSPDNLIALPEKLHVDIHNIMRRDGIHFDRAYIAQAVRLFKANASPGPNKVKKNKRRPVLEVRLLEPEETIPEKRNTNRSISSLYR